MKRIKKLLSLLIAFTLIFTMSGVVYAAADDTATISAYEKTDKKVAELSAATCTIKKNDNKYYYKNASGKTDKKTGWKKNQNGKYVYYVGSKGYVTEKISGGYWYHFSGKKFVKKSLSSYKNKTKTIGKKIFFVNSKGKIVLKSGWKKVSGVYTYYVTSTGSVSVKLTGKKYYKFSSGTFKAQRLKKYKNDRIKVKGKYFYVDKNGSLVKTAKTVTYKGYKYTIKKNGTCSKTKVKTTTNPGSGNNSSDTAGKKDTDKNTGVIPEHVHQWSPLAEDHTMLKDTNYVKHDAVTGKVWGLVTSEWTEKISDTRLVCFKCVQEKEPKDGEEWTDINNDGKWTVQYEGQEYYLECSFKTDEDYAAHSAKTNHHWTGRPKIVVETIVHPAVYGWVDTVITPAYTEWDENYRCTVCGDTMKVHVVCTYNPFTEKCTPEKSGDLLNIYGQKYKTVTAGVPY